MKIGQKIDIYNKNYEKVTGDVKKVSVIIPNYNYQNFIEERIDSVLRQTYPIYELIVLDDCSKDKSVEIIKKKLKSISQVKVKFIENKKNSGSVFKQWARGIKEATGDYFWIAEADDVSDPRFLETAIKGFDQENVILSYTESARIDENDIVIATQSQDLYNIYNTNRWDHDFVNQGKDEIKNYLSITNTILNVSSVVWKNKNYQQILEEASSFKVAGDWYVYYKALEQGDLAFSSAPYNYFRKHSQSVSTVIRADLEYQEICKLQEEISKKYELDLPIYLEQRRRRSYMDQNVSEHVRKKRIAWVMPHPGKGSGGHRTIIQNINALVKAGYECDIYVEEDYVSTSEMVKEKIDDYYGFCACNVYVGVVLRQEYDLVFATGWTTVDAVKKLNCKKKAYFIQDFEPWFLPMGDNYIKTENSYHLGYTPITIGKWLSHKMQEEYQVPSQYFDFCADINTYKKLEKQEKENAICYIYQPEKPRRCDELGLKALEIVKHERPDLKIYLYGSVANNPIPFDAEKLGILSIEECNALYNKCQLGLCISASNPSRIPFEMMAAGLPVVEIYKENNLYDFPKEGIRLAEPTKEAIASTILALLEDPKTLKEMSQKGNQYMQDYPLEKGYQQFVSAVDRLFREEKIEFSEIPLKYNEAPSKATLEVCEVANQLSGDNLLAPGGQRRRKLRRIKRRWKDRIKAVLQKMINFVERI